jgi:hypothetical protein
VKTKKRCSLNKSFFAANENKLIILGVVLFVVVGCYICFQKDVPLSDKEASIERDFAFGIPVGSTVKEADSYLDAHKIEHGELDQKTHDMTGFVRNVERDGFAITDVQVVLHFDEHDKMAGFVLQEHMRGVKEQR